MKKCKKCGVEKDESEFFKKRVRWLEGSCKICKKNREQELKSIDPESHREKVRLRSEKRRQTEEWKEWRRDHQTRNRKEISQKSRKYWEDNERVRDKAKKWQARNREIINASVKRHNERNPLKMASRRYLRTAIESGIIIRPDKCVTCFKECKPEAHHEDYMKPLEVVWLCRSCHGKEHRKHKE